MAAEISSTGVRMPWPKGKVRPEKDRINISEGMTGKGCKMA